MFGGPEVSCHQTYSARDWLSILRTPYPTQNLQRKYRTEMKLLRPLAGYTLYDHKTNDYIRRELRITGILDMIDEYRRNWLSHLPRMPQNHKTESL